MNALRRCFVALLLCMLAGESEVYSQENSASGPDPILGHWRWFNGAVVTVTPKVLSSTRGNGGDWKYLGTTDGERKYELDWGKGIIDTLSLSKDGNLLAGKNKGGDRVTGQRIHGSKTDQPRESKNQTAKGGTGTPATSDPIEGKWHFRNDHLVTIHGDGIMISANGDTGRWVFLKNPEVERKYRMQWDGSPVVDSVSLSRDGKKFEGRNSKGARIGATRVPSLTE